jgi:hypothetical protein
MAGLTPRSTGPNSQCRIPPSIVSIPRPHLACGWLLGRLTAFVRPKQPIYRRPMIIYNPMIFFEAIAGGILAFAISLLFPNIPSSLDRVPFFCLIAILDIIYRYWLSTKLSNKAPGANEPITPPKASLRLWWMVSEKGGHLWFVPTWAIGTIVCSIIFFHHANKA